jgi:hypothetical protein
MFKRMMFATVCALVLTTAAQAGWVPTGRTKFLPSPLPRVTGRPGQTVTLRGQLVYELKHSSNPRNKKWEPLKKATVWWSASVDGVIGIQIIYNSVTDNQGWATLKWTVPSCAKPGAKGKYTVGYDGGRLIGVPVQPCTGSGTLTVVAGPTRR